MLFEKLKARFPQLRRNEALKNHCTFRVGGTADFFYELRNIEELPELIGLAEENSVHYKLVGRGTNVLFTDKGFRGLIIKNISSCLAINETEVIADSGVLWSTLIRACIEKNLGGIEPLYGLPGTLGAAVWGNAGVPGVETGSFVKTVTLFNTADGIRQVDGSDIIFKYRWTSLQESSDSIMSVTLGLPKGDKVQSQKLLKEIDEKRRAKQPIGFSAGSFFKNPMPEKSAGYLLDQAGLKGVMRGDAEISTKHANFFINRGNATAKDILELGRHAQETVKKLFGIDLEMEVKIIGES